MTMFCNRAARCLAALTAVRLLTVPCRAQGEKPKLAAMCFPV